MASKQQRRLISPTPFPQRSYANDIRLRRQKLTTKRFFSKNSRYQNAVIPVAQLPSCNLYRLLFCWCSHGIPDWRIQLYGFFVLVHCNSDLVLRMEMESADWLFTSFGFRHSRRADATTCRGRNERRPMVTITHNCK